METGKDVGILTFQNAYNYGAILQAFALQEKIKSLGFKVEIIDFDNGFFKTIYSTTGFVKGNKSHNLLCLLNILFKFPAFIYKIKQRGKIQTFINKNLQLSEKCNESNISLKTSGFYRIVVGSDQVWNMAISNYCASYFLNFVNDNSKKVSYAASFGKEFLTGFERDLVINNLNTFNSISLREEYSVNMLKTEFNIESNFALDPTLLFDINYWSKFCSSKRVIKKSFVFVYLVQKAKFLPKIIERLAKQLNLEIVSISKLPLKHYHFIRDAGIEDFLFFLKNASYVFTTSYHGIAFSINFNKQFFYEIEESYPNNNLRMIDICKHFQIKGNQVNSLSFEINTVNFNKANDFLRKDRIKSMDFLNKALNNKND
jgi:hypothetical protein